MAADDLGPVEAACQDQFGDWHHAGSARLVLAERRGDFVTLLYHSDDPDLSASCVARNPQGTTDVTDINTGIGGSDGPAPTASPRSYTQGALSQFASPQTASVTDGAVGQDVTGVTIHAGSLTVTATVHDGRYVAWWPGPAFGEGAQRDSFLTYDLTLADGTTIRNAQPARPS
ncbi:MAG: hypothetical protein ACXVXG_07945 [Nocardioidaceae bacterium]